MNFNFAKYHGLGNDFIIVDERQSSSFITSDLCRSLCDRHTGIGADGVLFVQKSAETPSLCRMRIVNADGTEPEMCGNGLRCLAMWLFYRDEIEQEQWAQVETAAGVKDIQINDMGQVRVKMGSARVRPTHVHVPAYGESEAVELQAHAVDMGNPHLVLPLNVSAEQAAVLGEYIQRPLPFAQQPNVEFVCQQDARSMHLLVYERGVGLTHACGTGACAAVAAGVKSGKLEIGKDVEVHLPGGKLWVSVDEAWNVQMTGPATHVFDGIWLLDK